MMIDADDLPGPEILDVVGVGFGPSNLGLAIAVEEHNATAAAPDRVSARFIEQQDRFGWHRGMLLEDATMQVSYLKDLVTLRNPRSRHGFLSYLQDRARLVDFINYGSPYPTRREFHDYLEWAAADFAGQVDYGRQVVGVRPLTDGAGDAVAALEVSARAADGAVHRVRARNVVLATGLSAALPPGITAGPRIWHNRDLLYRAPQLPAASTSRFVVVGAGQSAAETVDFLHRTFPHAQVRAVFARYGYSPADDSSFANRVFDPSAVDEYYTAPPGVKEMILSYHANTNYSVVDPTLIDELYRRHYQEKVAGRERLVFCNVSRVAGVREVGERVEVAVESLLDGSRQTYAADVVVYATGYRPTDPTWLLADDLAMTCVRDTEGRLRVHRDYRLEVGPLPDGTPVRAGIYVQGPTEHTHGLSSTLLSNIAVRAGEIITSLAVRPTPLVGVPAAAVPSGT